MLSRADLLGPGTAAAGTLFATTFNNTLAAALAPFVADPGVRLIALDIFDLLDDAVADPAAISAAVAGMGLAPQPSEGSFVLVRFPGAGSGPPRRRTRGCAALASSCGRWARTGCRTACG